MNDEKMNDDKKNARDELTDHAYDGIQEYDNPMPRWWLYLFYATILYSILYVLNVPGVGIGSGRVANYERDVAAAREKMAAAQAAAPAVTEQSLRAIANDPVRREAGRVLFAGTCASCHREDAGGNIGPNLTDTYWIHGARPLDVHTVVSKGVLDKGMPGWSEVYPPDQIANVVGYVLSLRGTHPPNPKEPQGVEAEDDDGGPDHSHEAAGHGSH